MSKSATTSPKTTATQQASSTVREVKLPENANSSHPNYSSASEALAAGGPEAEAAYLRNLAAWVQDKDTVYPGQGGTLGWADFRPTVGLARSVRYWDNVTDDAERKRLEEEKEKEKPPPYGDGAPLPEDHAASRSDRSDRRESKVKEKLRDIFKHSNKTD